MLSKLPDPAKWKESPLQAALDPATHDPDLARVEAALRAKNFAGALRLMQTIAARYPHHPAIQYTYGKLALLLHSYTQAEHAFLAVAAIPKAAALGWYFAGATQFLENRPRDAVASMRRCIQAKPPTILAAYAWTAMGYYETLSGRAGDAVQAAQQGTRLAPTNGFIWAMRGFCDAGAHRFDTAIADYRRAIALNHRLAIAYEGLGSTYAQLDHPGDAIAPLKAALALAPGNYLAATQLGYCYLRCGQPADGAKACRQAVTARPGFSKAWDVLGLCYRQLGKNRDALAAFRQAVRTGPDDAGARAHLDQAAREAGTRT
jgi:tetratricopeptide (TPR) repeat protein